LYGVDGVRFDLRSDGQSRQMAWTRLGVENAFLAVLQSLYHFVVYVLDVGEQNLPRVQSVTFLTGSKTQQRSS